MLGHAAVASRGRFLPPASSPSGSTSLATTLPIAGCPIELLYDLLVRSRSRAEMHLPESLAFARRGSPIRI